MTKAVRAGSFLHFLSISFIVVKGKDGCRDLDYLPCTKNKTLTGHVIKSLAVSGPGLAMCQRECFNEGLCVSYNLGPVHGHARTCELSAADHWMRPNFLVSKEGFEYCPIKNPCSSSPCLADRLCTPDFSWNTFSCDDGGWTQWGNWMPCIESCSSRQTRKRNCTNPVPQNNGLQCVGDAQQTKACQLFPIKIQHVGCFLDQNLDRTLPDVLKEVPRPYSICSCALQAQAKGYTMFGIQNDGNACRTSRTARETYKKYGPATNCGSNGIGGALSNDVYRFVENP